jgi:membrane protein
MSVLEPLGENGIELTSNIIGFVENIKVGVLGSLGVAMLFYTIISLIQKVENAFNYVWRVSQLRSLARRFTDYLSVVMIGPLLIFTALGMAATAMNAEVVQNLQAIEPFGTLLLFATKLIPYLMIIFAFTFLYMFIPNTHVEFKSALLGGVVAGLLWVTTGKVFASFVASSSNYTAIYSSFAILFFFMIWLYLAWFILLTGSQVAFYLQHPNLVRLAGRHYQLSPRLREQEGLSVMTLLAKRFYEKQPAFSRSELEDETGLNGENLHDLLSILKTNGFVSELDGEESRFQPAQDIGLMSVKDILQSLRTAEEAALSHVTSQADHHVKKLMSMMSAQQDAVIEQLTIRDLVLGHIEHV